MQGDEISNRERCLALNRLKALVDRAKSVLREEGLISLVRKTSLFLTASFFRYETYYLYNVMLDQQDKFESLPDMQNINLEIVASTQQADKLVAEGLDFRSFDRVDGNRLDKGAIAFCIFIENELAHRLWVATTEKARESLTWIPYKMDFSQKQAYLGVAVTNPKYRNLRLWSYIFYKTRQYLRANDITSMHYFVSVDNTNTRRRLINKGYKPYAIGVYRKILWWTSWKVNTLSVQPDI